TTTGLSVTGGVIWDETGKWLLGYNRFLGKCLVFDTELWDILDAKMSLTNDEDLCMFDSPPVEIQVILKEDRDSYIL
ncbi:hypothetical protein Goarm_022671, partial [Gossypium armourianum]|nr:hypothetical protein [Gossypium armourianum]